MIDSWPAVSLLSATMRNSVPRNHRCPIESDAGVATGVVICNPPIYSVTLNIYRYARLVKPPDGDGEPDLDGRHLRSRRSRRAIVLAATSLFVDIGYGSTSMTAIAARAGVSVQTLYASFGTKRAILAAALDQAISGDDRAVVVNDRDWMHDVFNAATAAQRLRAYSAAVARIMAGAGEMFMVVATAATTDPECVALATITEGRRRTGATSVIDSVLTVGSLRASLTKGEAIDILCAFNSPALFDQLVRRSGWSLDQYRSWLGAVLVRELISVKRPAVQS